jgi:hypothetical protein
MSWLKDTSNRDEAYWVARVQQLISKNTTDREDGHGDTDTKWIQELVDEVVSNLPSGDTYDGNMRCAAIISHVLALWYSQLHYAKTQDSHRPTFERQRAYHARLAWQLSLVQALLDISNGPTYFPGQPWQNPFDGDARGGTFL